MSIFGGGRGKGPTRINDLAIQTSSLGVTLTKGWGTGRVKANLMWYGDFKSITKKEKSGGKGAPKTTSYTYSASVILGIASGPITSVPTVYRDKEVTSLGAAGLSLATGTLGQAVWGYLTTNHPTQALGYSGIAYAYASNYPLTDSATLSNHSFEVVFPIKVSGKPDANPADIIEDVLENPHTGIRGWEPSLLGDLTDYSDYCLAAGLLLSPILEGQVTSSEFIQQQITDPTNAYIFWSEGVLKVKALGDATITGNGVTWVPDLDPVYDLNESDFLSPPTQEILDQTEAYNRVEIEYQDRGNQYNVAVEPAHDLSNIIEFGERKEDTTSIASICDKQVAQRVAQLRLQRKLYIREKYRFSLPDVYSLLEQGDIVTLTTTTDAVKFDRKPVRILEVMEEGLFALSFVAEAVTFDTASAADYTTHASEGYSVDTNAAPGDVSTPSIINAPLSLTDGEPEVWIAAGSDNPVWGGCEVWASSDNTNYSFVGRIDQPCRYGQLTSTLASAADPHVAGSFSVDLSDSRGILASVTDQARDVAATLMVVDNELISYKTATLTSTYHYNISNLRRGLYGSTISSHISGSRITRLDEDVLKLPYDRLGLGTTSYFKFLSFNIWGNALQTLDEVTSHSRVLLPLNFGVRNYGAFSLALSSNLYFEDGRIQKIGGTAAWNESAYSLQGFTSGAMVSWKSDTTLGSLVGLNTDPISSVGYDNIDYAIRAGGSSYEIYESGVLKESGSSTPGDLFTIHYDNFRVVYKKNNIALAYSSVAASGLTLHLDTSFYHVGSYVDNLSFSAPGLTGASGASAYTLVQGGTKYSLSVPGTVTRLEAGAQTTEAFRSISPYPGGVTVSWTVPDRTKNTLVGLDTSSVMTATTIGDATDYGIYVYAVDFAIYRAVNGTYTQILPPGTAANDDYYSFTYDGKQIIATRNGTVIDTYDAPDNQVYYVRGVIINQDGAITNLTIAGAGKTGENGVNAITGFLTNESHTLPADASGNVLSYAGATGLFKVFSGTVDVSASFTLSTVGDPQALTEAYVGSQYTVSGGLDAGEDSASLTIRATGSGAYTGVTIDKVFSLAKSKAGSNGTNGTNGIDGDDGLNAKLLVVTSDRQTIAYDGTGAATPSTQTTTFSTTKQNTTATVNWTLTDAAGVNRTPVTSFLSSATGDSVTMTEAQFASARNGTAGVIVTGTLTDGSTLTDKISVVRVQAGTAGANGASSFTLVNKNNMDVSLPSRTHKLAGTGDAWDGKAYTAQGYIGGAYVSMRIGGGDQGVGLTTDPTANDSYDTVDYWLHNSTDGNVYVYKNGGTGIVVSASWAIGDTLSVHANGGTVRYFKNQTELLAVAHAQNNPPEKLHGVFNAFHANPAEPMTDIVFVGAGTVGASAYTLTQASTHYDLGIPGQVTLNANTGWEYAFRSGSSYPMGVSVSWTVSDRTKGVIVGFDTLSETQGLSPNMADRTDYGVYVHPTDFGIYRGVNGAYTTLLPAGTAVNGDRYTSTYDGKQIVTTRNGVVIDTYDAPDGQSYYVRGVLLTSGGVVSNLTISPAGKRGENGVDAITAFLTNESHTLPADSSGAVTSYSGAEGLFKVFSGTTDVSASFTLSTQADPQGLTEGYAGSLYGVYGGFDAGEGSASLTIRATGSGAFSGIVIDKVFSLSKSVAGSNGANGSNGTNGTNGIDGDDGLNAKLLVVTSDRQTIAYDGTGAATPSTQTTTFSTTKQNTTATVNWTLTDAAGVNRTPVTSFLSSATGDSVTMTEAQFASARNGTAGVIVTGTLTDGSTLTDKISVVRVQAGTAGANGSDGDPGADAFTVTASPALLNISCLANGTPRSGQIPVSLTFRVLRGTTDVSDSADLDYVINGSSPTDVTKSLGGTNNKVLTVTAVLFDLASYVDIDISWLGSPVTTYRVIITKTKDGYQTGVPLSDDTLTANNSSSYGGSNGGPITKTIPGGSTITASVNLGYSATGSFARMAGKFRYRTTPGSGSWLDFDTGEVEDPTGAFVGEPSLLAFSDTVAGPSTSATWEFDFVNRRKIGTGTMSVETSTDIFTLD